MTKVLIVHPDLRRLGGIETYFLKLKPHLKVAHASFPIAQRPGETRIFGRVLRILGDYVRFWSALSAVDIEIVHLNPSLERKSFYREGLFHLMAKLRRKKTLIFFHGWSAAFQQRIDDSGGAIFRRFFSKADAFIVLASAFSEKLREWGADREIFQEVTIIGDETLTDFDIETAIENRLKVPGRQVIFASRLIRNKGVTTTIKALGIMQSSSPNISLCVAGDGELADESRELVRRLDVSNAKFVGAVDANDMAALYRASHVLCFPTQHDEGFPNVIVEAMAFGLPIVTRPVGGIPDFFEPGVHGYLTDSTEPEEFARLVLRICEDSETYGSMARANFEYARTHFLASDAARRMDRIYAAIAPD